MADDRNGIDEFSELEFNEKRSHLLELIEGRIMLFSESTTLQKITSKKKAEPNHTTAFNQFMMKGQNKFAFHAETAQKGTHKADIHILDMDTDETIFIIEAKILPTPPSAKRKEHEYVYGEKGAGIQRFKEGKHGVDFEDNLLDQNGMIAYIKEKDFAHWHTQINQWIMDAGWGESENLNPKYENQLDKYKSQHKRGKNDNVTLHHFWVQVAPHHIPTNPKVYS